MQEAVAFSVLAEQQMSVGVGPQFSEVFVTFVLALGAHPLQMKVCSTSAES